ncbi:large ribosomal subunit protein mL62 [Arctopsyche grandis]|uniref:large ribosomal subunit protein mL62 n=1 Tax=Arctopsyche grandis TaxID=121162 RepID=UPI00406D752B
MSGIFLPVARNIFSSVILLSRTQQLLRPLSYKSSLSLDTLYPKSSTKITTPDFVPQSEEKFDGFIPINKLQVTYSCSSGPGGQNVNKVQTKVDLRFNVADADWLDASLREKILEKNRTSITKEGFLVIRSELTRSQQLNLADCMLKLRNIIRNADAPPPKMSKETPEMLRRRAEKAARERLYEKREASLRRVARQPPTMQDL